MYNKLALASFTLLAAARGQQVGTLQAETHPGMAMQVCSTGGTCTTKNTEVVIDANWRWLHTTEGYTNCYTGNEWNAAVCPDAETCSTACAVDGADYAATYGITTPAADALTLKFVTKTGTGTNIGSRVYLLADDSNYQAFNLKNNEFTFDVDMSNLPCGLNGALYFSQMDIDGGMAKNPTNKAGAKYGTGYCDAQCPHDMKFINGEANLIDWTPSANDKNSGSGKYGTCCTEMDIWEANLNAAAYTPHACKGNGLTRCEGTDCGDADERYDGICDKDGCDFNSYRMGDKTFLGPGKTVDTNSKFTVVTQFITADGTDSGALTSIKRFYVQGGKTIANSQTDMPGVTATNEITDEFCAQQKSVFGDNDYFKTMGGMTGFSTALDSPMVLSMSIWDDHSAEMKWLDSTYPVGSTSPGSERGPCDAAAGVPETVEGAHPDASVTFSNIKFGPIGSTFSGGNVGPVVPPVSSTKIVTSTKAPVSSTKVPVPATSTMVVPTSSTAAPTGAAVAKYGQCGGIGYSGSTVCVAGSTCTLNNEYYSQCL